MSTTELPKLRADARRNRERIIVAARQVFGEKGEEAQMDDVARQAGVGVGTVYRHFPSKEVLMGELVKQKFEAITERTREALEQDDAWEAFCELLRRSAEIMAEDAALQDTLRRTGAAYEYAEAERLKLEEVADELIARAQRQGEMREDFRASELGMLMGGVCASMSAPAGAPDDWRRHLEILLDGLRAR
jgi:AcrR family transcriptional regulator